MIKMKKATSKQKVLFPTKMQMISYQVIKTSGALHFDYEGKLKLKMIEQK